MRRSIRTAWIGPLLVVAALLAACSRTREPRVTSAIRTEKLQHVGVRDIYAESPRESLLLVITVAGIDLLAFDSLPKDSTYLASDAQRFALRVVGGTWSSSGRSADESVELVAVVPRSALRFTLHLGRGAPIEITADTTIRLVVRRPES